MKKWLKRLFSSEKEEVIGWDFGSGDKSTIVKGYKDKKGVLHIAEIKQWD